MKADFVLIGPRDGSSKEVEVDNVEMENIQHIPQIGEMIFYGGRDYTVFEVTWNFEKDVVFIGARF